MPRTEELRKKSHGIITPVQTHNRSKSLGKKLSSLAVITFVLLGSSLFSGQQKIKNQAALKKIEHKIDSLKTLQKLINKKMIEIDNQINQLTKLKSEIEFKEATPIDDIIGVTNTDIHMKLTNGVMSKKIKAKSRVLILDYSSETEKFKINYRGQIGYLSDSWIEQTGQISKYKRTKAREIKKETEALNKAQANRIAAGQTWIEQTRQKTRQKYIAQHPNLDTKIKSYILTGRLLIGMTKEMAIASIGKPTDVNKSVYQTGTHEQWIYGTRLKDRRYLYFENGILTAWQDF